MTEMTWTGFPYDENEPHSPDPSTSVLSEKFKEKLFEFNFGIISGYCIDKTKEYMIITDDMILAVNDRENTVAVAFEATTPPDVVAKRMLILKEVEGTETISVMESFVFENNHLVTGDDAVAIAKKRLGREAINEFLKSQVYMDIIQSEKCFNC
jgi:hypothetical protein